MLPGVRGPSKTESGQFACGDFTFFKTDRFERGPEHRGVHQRFEGADFDGGRRRVCEMQAACSDDETLLIGEAERAEADPLGVFGEAREFDVCGEIDFTGPGQRIGLALMTGVFVGRA